MRPAISRWSVCSKVEINSDNLKLLSEADVGSVKTAASADATLKTALCALSNPVTKCPIALASCQTSIHFPYGFDTPGLHSIDVELTIAGGCDVQGRYELLLTDSNRNPWEVLSSQRSGNRITFAIFVDPNAFVSGDDARIQLRHNGKVVVPNIVRSRTAEGRVWPEPDGVVRLNVYKLYCEQIVTPGFCQRTTPSLPIATKAEVNGGCGVPDEVLADRLRVFQPQGASAIRFSNGEYLFLSDDPPGYRITREDYEVPPGEHYEVCGWWPRPAP